MSGAATSPFTIDRYGAEGFRVIAALYAQAFDDPWPEPSVRELLSTPGTVALIAKNGPGSSQRGEPVGFLLLRTVLDEAEVLALGVPKSARRRGVARALMAAGLDMLSRNGVTAFFLEVGRDNPAAIALYDALGFHRQGLRRNYYRRADGTRVDAILMRLDC